MSEEGRSSQNVNKETYIRNFAVQKRLWLSFDEWFRKDPTKYSTQFEHVKSAMLLHSGHTTVVMDHIRESNEMLTENSTAEYAYFMKIAGSTAFLNGDHSEFLTAFDLLSEMFTAVPEYKNETGRIRDYLKTHLKTLLGAEVVWDNLPFYLHAFRKTFRHLKRLLSSKEDTKNHPQLHYASFITAILIAIWKENDTLIGTVIPQYDTVENVWMMMTQMTSSPYFRNLSFFFIIGFWLLVKFRREGGYVTDSPSRPPPEQQDMLDEKEFQRRVSEGGPFDSFLKFPDDSDMLLRVQMEWEVFAIDLLKKGLLKSPEDGYRVVKKGGRPRKYNKRKLEENSHVDEDPNPTKRPKQKAEKTIPKKKHSRKSSIKVQTPLVTSSIGPPVSPKAVTPEPTTPDAKDVGLEPPIFMQQQAIFVRLREEIAKRRNNPHLPQFDYQKFIYESYDEIHRIETLTRLSGEKELTAEQKAAHERFREKYWKPHKEESPQKRSVPELQQVPAVIAGQELNPPQAKRRGRRKAQ